MIKACVLNTRNRASSKPIGNMWYSNGMAAGGEAIAVLERGKNSVNFNAAAKAISKGYKVGFLCFGRASHRNPEYVDLIRFLRRKGMAVILQQVHNLDRVPIASVKAIAAEANALVTPVEAFADHFKRHGVNAFYFPNAVDVDNITKFKNRKKKVDIFIELLSDKHGYSNHLKVIQSLPQHKFFSTIRPYRESWLSNLNLIGRIPQADFYERLCQARVACDLGGKQSFGRFAIECGLMGVPIIGFGSRDSQKHVAPELTVSSPAEAIEKIKLLLSDQKVYNNACKDVLHNSVVFYGPKAWKRRYRRLLKSLFLEKGNSNG